MSIEDFHKQFYHDGNRSSEDICDQWEKEKEVDDFLGMELSSGVMVADLLIGDGTLDQVSPELKNAFQGLMGEKADSYTKIHQILLEKLEIGDSSVLGTVNKIKGQIGEEIFKESCAKEGIKASLASSGSQKGWDVAIENGDEIQYVQVKMYSDPNGVIREIKKVEEQLKAGEICGENGLPIKDIDWAVPKDIAPAVQEKLEELGLDVNVFTVDTTAGEVASIVQDGFDNMGSHALENLFGELLGSAVTTAALHAIVNGFLVYKGAKQAESFLSDTLKSASVSVVGIASGMSVEMVLNQVAWIGGFPTSALVFVTSFSTRAIAKRIIKRGDATAWALQSNKDLDKIILSVQAA